MRKLMEVPPSHNVRTYIFGHYTLAQCLASWCRQLPRLFGKSRRIWERISNSPLHKFLSFSMQLLATEENQHREGKPRCARAYCKIKTYISIPVQCVLYYFVLWQINAQLFHKLSHSHMFRHYRVILRQLVINTLPSYTSISNAAVGNTVYS